MTFLNPFRDFPKGSTDVYQQLFASHRANYRRDICTDGSIVYNNIVDAHSYISVVRYHLPGIYSAFAADLSTIFEAMKYISIQNILKFIIY